MAEAHDTPDCSHHIDELRQEMQELRDNIQVLTDVLDEVRQELQWLSRNGLPPPGRTPDRFVVNQMAADPCAKDWGERLVIVRGSQPDETPAPIASPATGLRWN